MDDPIHARALTLRRAYFYPFWRIEASAKRWEWDIAKRGVRPGTGEPRPKRRSFCDYWRKRLFDTAADNPRKDGFIYIPLQGMLLEQRSFQTLSPLEMIETTLRQDPTRRVIAGYHPNETYSPEETDALEAMAAREPRLDYRDRRNDRTAAILRLRGDREFVCRTERLLLWQTRHPFRANRFPPHRGLCPAVRVSNRHFAMFDP